MLSKEQRLSRNAVNHIISSGQRTRTGFFSASYLHNYLTQPRFAVVVSKKVAKKAVDRNRIRRRVYRVLQNSITELSPVQGVIFAQKGAENLSLEETHDQIMSLIKKTRAYEKKEG